MECVKQIKHDISLPQNHFKFNASDSWCKNFKKRNRIRSRKIVKIVSMRQNKQRIEIENSIKEFQGKFLEKKKDFFEW